MGEKRVVAGQESLYRPARGAPGAYQSHATSWLRFVCSTNHEDIGTMYLGFAMLAGLIGIFLSWTMHAELMQPGLQIFTGARKFNVFVTGHELIIACFVIMPSMVGGFGSWFTPLMIGAPDMAFPRVNSFSFWLLLSSFLVLFLSMFVEGSYAGQTMASSWTTHASLSTYGLPPSAMSLAIVALVLAGMSAILSAINFITTIFNMRAPGMTLRKMPLFVWSILVAAVLLLVSIPVLAAAITMLLTDPHFGTRFFNPAGAGDSIPFQHLLWFFGHPEIYILIIPGFGVISQVVSTFSKRPVFGHLGMVYAMVSIGFTGFLVWAHHMYTVGMIVDTKAHFQFAAMFVAVPIGINLFSWIATMWGGSISLRTPMLWAIGVIVLLVVGGVTGLALANAGANADVAPQDTNDVVTHFQYLLSLAAVFAIFAGWYYWFPKITGYMVNETLGKQHFWITFLGVFLVLFPRLFTPLAGWVSPLGATIAGFGVLVFVATIVEAFLRKRIAGDNPWGVGATTLEWTVSSPPPFHSRPLTRLIGRQGDGAR